MLEKLLVVKFYACPLDELAKLRLAFAKHYLTQSEMTSQEIATLLGYDKPGSLSRAFRKATEMTPQEFRDHSRRTTPSNT